MSSMGRRFQKKKKKKDVSHEEWEYNASTGHDILRLRDNARIIRDSYPDHYGYRAEFWGDYSLKYPVRGPYRLTLPQAKKDAQRLARKFVRESR